jgi:hypothetical protein
VVAKRSGSLLRHSSSHGSVRLRLWTSCYAWLVLVAALAAVGGSPAGAQATRGPDPNPTASPPKPDPAPAAITRARSQRTSAVQPSGESSPAPASPGRPVHNARTAREGPAKPGSHGTSRPTRRPPAASSRPKGNRPPLLSGRAAAGAAVALSVPGHRANRRLLFGALALMILVFASMSFLILAARASRSAGT